MIFKLAAASLALLISSRHAEAADPPELELDRAKSGEYVVIYSTLPAARFSFPEDILRSMRVGLAGTGDKDVSMEDDELSDTDDGPAKSGY